MSEPKDFCYQCTNGQYLEDLEEEIAKLREQLAAAKSTNKQFDELVDELTAGYEAASCINPVTDMRNAIYKIRGLLEAAEAKLKAASEQEPMLPVGGGYGKHHNEYSYQTSHSKLYAAPVPPVGVQELQNTIKDLHRRCDTYIAEAQNLRPQVACNLREIEAKAKRIAELERKLAEQQATVKNFFGMYARELPDVGEELNTLLAQAREEGRKDVVPEGWQVAPKEPTPAMVEACWAVPGVVLAYRAMLAAAPTPGENE